MIHSPTSAAVTTARQYTQAKPVYLDTETTGLYAGSEIVEICILDHDGSSLLDTLVRPQHRIPFDAIQIHGITNTMVQDAPTWVEVWPLVSKILAGRMVGIYNADFDLRMMQQSHTGCGMGWIHPAFEPFCIMKLYAQYRGGSRWQSLDAAGRQCGILLANAHRARADSLLARAVLLHMAR